MEDVFAVEEDRVLPPGFARWAEVLDAEDCLRVEDSEDALARAVDGQG